MTNIIKDAEQLLEKCPVLSVSSVTEIGYPRICFLAKIKAEGCKVIYFSTGTNSAKITHYLKNPKAGVSYFNEGDSVTLLGKMTIIEDKSIKEMLWQDWFINHFPQGKNDPNYAIIKFEAEKATIYINQQFETVKL